MERAKQVTKDIEQINKDLTSHITEKFDSVKSVSILSGTIISVNTKCGGTIWFGCESRHYRLEESPVKISELETDKLKEHFENISQTKDQAQEIFEYIKSFCLKD
jgi:hypothetical protein